MPHLFRSCFGCIVIIAFLTVSHTTYTAAAEAQATEVLQRDSVDDLPSQAGSLDIAFVRLNLEIPSFSGMYLDKGGLKVMLQNMSDAEAARPKIVKFLRDNYALEYKEKLPVITFEHAKTELNWLDVYHYKLALRDVLTIQDTVLLDADEVCGCVTVGISNERARPVVENFIKMAGVPTNAVHVQLMPAIMPLQDVTGNFRPIVGGIQIKNDAGPFAFLGFSAICTVTIGGQRLGITGFITASHCTRVQGGIESTSFFQNGRTPFSLDYVGHESADPVWASGGPGCPTGSFCRMSDSAFVVIDIGSQNGALDTIAKPTALCLTTPICSLNMPSATSTLNVTGVAGSPMVGGIVTKVGRTTGWTGGAVTATCANIPQSGTAFVALCTSLAAAGSLGGDSGAPVFTIPTGSGAGATTATLVGILWGGGPGVSMAFSPIGAVVSELGSLALFPPQAAPPGPPAPPNPCVTGCSAGRNSCMKSVGGASHTRPQDCVEDYRECLNECRHPHP